MNKDTAQKFYARRNYLGFTLIELLIVVSLLGILAALTLSVISPARQQKVAEDAVRRSNIEKLSQSLGSFCVAEGRCPLATEITFSGAAATLSGSVPTYIRQWPIGTLSTTTADIIFTYVADSATSPQNFEVYVKMMTDTTHYIRYNSTWGQIRECTNFSTPTTWVNTCT